MPQTINTNVASLNAQRNLNTSRSSLATSMQRLSSGLRVNSTKDDAAGLAIADRMNAQIRGINVAIPTPTTASRWRRRPKARWRPSPTRCSACANSPCSPRTAPTAPSDRANLDAEYQQLQQEVDRIATQTKFNGKAIVGADAGTQTFRSAPTAATRWTSRPTTSPASSAATSRPQPTRLPHWRRSTPRSTP